MFTVSLPKEFLSQKMEAVKSIQKSAYLTLICAFSNVREGCSLSYSTEAYQAINNILSNPTQQIKCILKVYKTYVLIWVPEDVPYSRWP